MSRAAVKNQDRKRTLVEVDVPPIIAAQLEPGTRAYRMGGCLVMCSKQKAGWHLSVSRTNRLPSWEDVREARYELIPDEATMALLLPPKSEYVNAHEFCLQLYEIPAEYIAEHQDRL